MCSWNFFTPDPQFGFLVSGSRSVPSHFVALLSASFRLAVGLSWSGLSFCLSSLLIGRRQSSDGDFEKIEASPPGKI